MVSTENKNKTINLFKYIKELYAIKYKTITNVEDYEWYKYISAIHDDKENMVFNNMDTTVGVDESIGDESILFQIRKPDLLSPPILPRELNGWIKGNLADCNETLEIVEKYRNSDDNDEKTKLFVDSEKRVRLYEEYVKTREDWTVKQRILEKTRKMFNELHLKHIDLDRESETIELMIGQGILECELDDGTKIKHPILLKKVTTQFNALDNIISIVDTSSDPEIYTMMLNGIEYIDHACIKGFKDELGYNFYHPLDRVDTLSFMKSVAHSLHSDSKYYDIPNNKKMEKVTVVNDPVYFIRKRTGGVVKAIEEIITELEKDGDISGPILNLIGENTPHTIDSNDALSVNESLSAISGEDRDVLLCKEANKEQLDIAKRIENYNAVLVQGPPGTGKTHTIANLTGHFLSQGKSVLVTSHTKKALTVVKEKLPAELQNLCVSVLDDNNKDMERSVDGITEYIASFSSMELLEDATNISKERDSILSELDDVRSKIFSIKNKEYESIVFGGDSFSPSQAAKYVYDNRDTLSYIPGKVLLDKPLPVSIDDLALLYKTNSSVTVDEERELNAHLPNPEDLLNSDEISKSLMLRDELQAKSLDLASKLNKNINIDFKKYIIKLDNELLCSDFNYENMNKFKNFIRENTIEFNDDEDWRIHALVDSKKGGGFKDTWQTLVNVIKQTHKIANDYAVLLLGKSVTTSVSFDVKTIATLNEMKETLENGKRIDKKFMKSKKWIEIYSNTKINDDVIRTPKDCDVILAHYALAKARSELSFLWDSLIGKNGRNKFSDFGDCPEEIAISYIPKINLCMNWYTNTYETIKQMAIENNINVSIFELKTLQSNLVDEVKEIVKIAYNDMYMYIELMNYIMNDLSNLDNKLSLNALKIDEAKDKSSVICANLSKAMKDENVRLYDDTYNELLKIYEKYYYVNQRKRILDNITKYAPDWAAYIRQRVGIHGEDTIPDNIQNAWKWKQFAGTIDDITAQPFEELQHRAVYLSSELRQCTTKLATKRAWYHLISRVNNDVSQQQALQGWKQTIRKIGKGTGKNAPAHKRRAKELMAKCQTAVPAWVMPITKALESLDPKTNKFDVVIIDEASQSDISALAIIYLAKKIIIVGDDQQVSPSSFMELDKVNSLANMYITNVIPNAHLYDMNTSLYDIAKTSFPTLMLREHFRCVPNIIGYSNRLSYDYKIQPLRDDSSVSVKPATVSCRVKGGMRNVRRKVNEKESEMIVALMLACMEFEEYKGMSFGAISLLGDQQARIINELALNRIGNLEYEERRILCGSASHFQGDERDIIFLSVVDNNEGEGPLRMTGEGVRNSTKQRYNVAASRAKNQLWVVHSLDVNSDLKSGDMRKDLIEYAMDPNSFSQQIDKIKSKADSPFEVSVVSALCLRGYNIVQQWKVGSYSIDMVAICGDKKVAIECDGELYHSGEDKIREDMERQTILERLGWTFIRIRGSEFYQNPDLTIERVVRELTKYDINPETTNLINEQTSSLKERVIIRAEQILEDWHKEASENTY